MNLRSGVEKADGHSFSKEYFKCWVRMRWFFFSNHFFFFPPCDKIYIKSTILTVLSVQLGSSYKQNHTLFVLLCLAYLIQQNIFKVHPCCINRKYPNSIPFEGWVIFHYMYVPHFIHSSVSGPLGWVRLLAIVNNPAENTGYTYILKSLLSILLDIHEEVELR